MGQIDYKVFFNNIDCAMIVFLEDDFSLYERIGKSELIYSISRMDVKSRNDFILEIGNEYSDFALSLDNFSECMDELFPIIAWDDVIKDDMEEVFKKVDPSKNSVLKGLYDAIELPNLETISKLLLKYGLCINVPSCYKAIVDDYLRSEDRWKPFRIYVDFDAEDARSFINDLQKFYQTTGNEFACFCCIIDDELSGEKRAKDIINEIKNFNSQKRKSIIGAIVTSYESVENIDEHVFLEYVQKSSAETNLQSALLKSTYNFAISVLKDELMKNLDDAFSKATTNRNIAFYLSRMALYEGITNYQIINTWINTMCNYELSKSDVLPYIFKLTNLIHQIEIENCEISNDLDMLNTYEAFDYNVNKFYQPPAAGDIFIDDKDNIYILVGQDCDIMMSETRKRRNAIAELIPAQIVAQKEIYKLDNNLKYMMINNFRKNFEDSPSCLKINYTKRFYLENQLIDLCTFNSDGSCCISLDMGLSEESSKIMIPYLVEYYSKLQKYFSSVKNLKSVAEKDFNLFLNEMYTPRLISIHAYNEISINKISYPLRRICRLTETYILYLYKLYLEYRGRHPYNSINLARCQSLDISLIESPISGEINVQVILSGNRNENLGSDKLHKLPWEISRGEVLKVLSKLNINSTPTDKNEYIVLKDIENNIFLENGHVLKMTKKKRGIKVEVDYHGL